MDPNLFFLLLFLIFVGLFVYGFRATRQAEAMTRVRSGHEPEETVELVRRAFGGARSVVWTSTDGPGTINMRRRGRGGGTTMSIDIEPLTTGGSAVSMWASSSVYYFGVLAGFPGSVNSRKKAISRALGT